MPEQTSKQAHGAALSDIMLASARNVRAVLAGRSLSDSLGQTQAGLRAPAQAIAFHTMRHLGLARQIKQILLRRTPPDPVFDALLLVAISLVETAAGHAGTQADDGAGVAATSESLSAADRHIPVYAVHTVVNQAVTVAGQQRGMQRYKALLNGALRRFLRERPAILAQARQNPEAVYNHPAWWIKRLRKDYPNDWQALLRAANQPGPMILRVNARRSSVSAMLDELGSAGIDARQAGADAILLPEPRPVQAIPGFDEGKWSVQDLAAQQAARLLPLQPGMRVLDACSAPGGKTAHMLERADLNLLALDADAQRLARVSDNLRRLRLDGPHVQVRCAEAENLETWWDGQCFDAVLADVPCTGSGVVRRHPDIRWLRREEDIARTSALQARIMDTLWQTVRPGGHMLYATCSIFPQECGQQAEAFAARHADAQALPAPGQILPLERDGAVTCDGFFYALFAKKA